MSQQPTPTVLSLRPLHPNLGRQWPLPAPQTAQAAGFDLVAALDEAVVLAPGERDLIPCGFAMALCDGFEAQIRPRSGLALRHGITCLNSPGTIDADYRGEVKVILINHGQEPYTVEPGARIAQLVVAQVAAVRVEVVHVLTDSQRGTGGFGSTG